MTTKISKAEHEVLPDSLKDKFIEDGDGFSMVEEDVSGLKANHDKLLREKKQLEQKYEGIDPEKAKEALAESKKLESEKLLSRQKFDEVLAARQKEFDEKYTALENKFHGVISNNADKELQLKLIASGVREDRAEDLAIILKTKHIKFVEENGQLTWRTADDTQTVELDKYIPSLKESKADYFKANGASGSGASGSQSNNNNNGANRTSTDVAPGYNRLVNAYAESAAKT